MNHLPKTITSYDGTEEVVLSKIPTTQDCIELVKAIEKLAYRTGEYAVALKGIIKAQKTVEEKL